MKQLSVLTVAQSPAAAAGLAETVALNVSAVTNKTNEKQAFIRSVFISQAKPDPAPPDPPHQFHRLTKDYI